MTRLINHEPISPYELTDNPFDLLDRQWMLVTAGSTEAFNTMTASWGGFGILWNKPVAFVFIRPQRHTFRFAEEHSGFTLSFFAPQYRKALEFCGSKSGRDYDKPKATGLTPVSTPANGIAFQEARLILDCQKLYADFIKAENFVERAIIDRVYPGNDFHRLYVAEIVGCYAVGNGER
jgi:flavin reductase (DIM6/NTAB) family NADH-FMN oxidoreductase RutF